jgi:hypothetical protein
MSTNAENRRGLQAAQLRALASPARIEIVGAFQSHGAMAIRELAEKLERRADGLYHHVRQLERAGILQVAQTRRVGKRDEAVFALTAERFANARQSKTTAMKDAMIRSATAALRLAAREFRRAILAKQSAAALPGAQADESCAPQAKLARQRSWLTSDDLKELHALLAQVEAFLQQRMDRKQGRAFAVTIAIAPLIKGKRT